MENNCCPNCGMTGKRQSRWTKKEYKEEFEKLRDLYDDMKLANENEVLEAEEQGFQGW